MLTADTQDAPSTPTANTPAPAPPPGACAPRRASADAAGSIAPLEPRAGAPPALPTPVLTADTQDAPSTPTANTPAPAPPPVVMDGSIAPLELLRVIGENAVAGAWAKARAPATYLIMDDGGERAPPGNLDAPPRRSSHAPASRRDAKKDGADGYELMVCGAMRSAADYRRGKKPLDYPAVGCVPG
ncbi:hypothetical protein SO694_00049058 [Aureococcus anophagefferens]|uniref:Uncharacterized protein n=1 Tax=Aureococcus anophagefferens TaxID=44056 RepID=A0ABR1G808_AURAN